MPDHSSHQRQTAAREFMRSLGQLESVLQSEEAATPPSPKEAPAAPKASLSQSPRQSSPPPMDSDLDWESALAEAAADIEEFMNTHEP